MSGDPAKMTVGHVLTAMEGPVMIAPCSAVNSCERSSACATRVVWQKANEAIEAVFASATIADLVRHAERTEASRPFSFDI
jgi:Rrf2 family transcriptional regulator, cysteine metabolism repressor